MKKQLVLGMVALSATALSAGDTEISVIVSKQFTRDSDTYTVQTLSAKAEVQKPTAVALRLGQDLIGIGPAQLQLQLSYHAQSSAEITVKNVQDGSVLPSNGAKYKNQGYSVGLQFQWRLLVDLGLGAEVRYESLKALDESASQTRPWLNARLGFHIPTPLVKPIFGIEVAAPLTKTKDIHDVSDALKNTSPQYEAGIYVGLRF